ncbi:helix-turn-helix domain-containing protein [Sessilibacter corallicola]|uniref:helix-turn-helix domain-containing protein n=1 Tax=Sessilibacter corallicola TaxID=2904075 RepID=UPI001E3BF213|nr:XRE family transcriptional regulator [Sessilibacter corallicola]MCE2027023.1 XRE family transcriptional regulator [Sessilibacter corallicola]
MSMARQFNPSRLRLARMRRQFTLKHLSELVGLSTRMVSGYEKDNCKNVPPEDTVLKFSSALNYPADFFLSDNDVEIVNSDTVSFRSLKAMKASQQHAAVGAGSLGLILDGYFDSKFNLPHVNLPDLRGCEPEAAADELRELWDLGSLCINNMIHLLEKHGIRVFSLAENTQAVDAFSFWKNGKPYIFLNTQKSGERSRMDAAHELGHLLLHKHGSPQGKAVEMEADSFAAFFLMPRRTVLACSSKYLNIEDVLDLRPNWKTSAMAVIMQLRTVGAITEWHHRNLIIEASKLGLRKTEINGIDREKTLLLEMYLKSLENDGINIKDIANKLSLPLEEITNLIFRFGVVSTGKAKPQSSPPRAPKLQLVK